MTDQQQEPNISICVPQPNEININTALPTITATSVGDNKKHLYNEQPDDHKNDIKTRNDDGDEKAAIKIARRNNIRLLLRLLAIIVIDIGLPIALFFICNRFTTAWIALIVAGIPSILRITYIFIRHRRFDYLNSIFIIAFGVSAAVSAISGDVRVLLLREVIIMGLMALVFLVTLVPIKTRWFTLLPLTHLCGREVLAVMPEQVWTDETGIKHVLPLAEWMWQEMRVYRILNCVLTLTWGLCFVADAASRLAMIYVGVPVDQVIAIGVIVSAVTLSSAGVASTIMFVYLRRRCISYKQEWQKMHDFATTVAQSNSDTNSAKSRLVRNNTYTSTSTYNIQAHA